MATVSEQWDNYISSVGLTKAAESMLNKLRTVFFAGAHVCIDIEHELFEGLKIKKFTPAECGAFLANTFVEVGYLKEGGAIPKMLKLLSVSDRWDWLEPTLTENEPLYMQASMKEAFFEGGKGYFTAAIEEKDKVNSKIRLDTVLGKLHDEVNNICNKSEQLRQLKA